MKRRVLTITLAVLLAVLGTVGVLAYVNGANARALAGQKAVTVLVAQQPIPAGTSASTALHEGLLASQQLPASSVPADAVSAITPELSALVMSANVPAGQLLLRPMLVTAAQATAQGARDPARHGRGDHPALPPPGGGRLRAARLAGRGLRHLLHHEAERAGTACGEPIASVVGSGRHRTRLVLPRVLVLSVGSAQAAERTAARGAATSAESSSTTAGTSAVLVTVAVSQADASG